MLRSSRRAGSFSSSPSLIPSRASSQSDPIHSNPSLLQSLGRVWELLETELSCQQRRKTRLPPNHDLIPRDGSESCLWSLLQANPDAKCPKQRIPVCRCSSPTADRGWKPERKRLLATCHLFAVADRLASECHDVQHLDTAGERSTNNWKRSEPFRMDRRLQSPHRPALSGGDQISSKLAGPKLIIIVEQR